MAQPQPPYELVFESRKDYLYARISAKSIDPAIAMQYLSAISHKCTECRCEQLMLVRNIPKMLSDSDLYFTVTGFQHMIGTRKVAFVNPYREIREDMKFAIVVGMNRGGQFNIFDTEVEAERWLLE
jgi:hypothetical protein